MEAGITVLETQVVVLKIGMISVEKACFEAEMRVVTTWQEPKLEIEKSVVHPITLNSGYWMPLLGVQNVIGNLETLSRRIGIDPVRKSFLVQEVILWGEFSFEPDNFYFPLDIQSLKLMLYCENSENRKVLIVNSLNLLHYIRHDFHCLSADFAIHDVIDSATLSDQNYHKKYFSILRITFYISRVLRDRNSRWLTFPFLVAMTTMFILSVDNMNPSDQMITLVAVHIFLSIARKFLTWSVAFSVVELYWWCLSILSTLSLLWCGLQFYDFFPFGKVILLFLYPFVVAFFSCWFFLEPYKRKENLINNSLIYKATMLNLQGDHELVLPSKRRTVRYNYPQTILDHQPGEVMMIKL